MTFKQRIVKAWNALLGKEVSSTTAGAPEVSEDNLKYQSEIASMKLDLEEMRDKFEKEVSHRKGIESSMEKQVLESIESRMMSLMEQLASPLSQLRMLLSAYESGKEVDIRDMATLLKKAAETIEKAGMEPIGITGSMLKYSAEIAKPLEPGIAVKEGDEVIVRIIGYRYKNRVLRKALVTKD